MTVKLSRLWQVFDRLSMEEKRELAKAVRSPWFNKREYVVVLFNYLRVCAKQPEPNPTKSEAFKAMFPDEEYSDTLMRNAMSLLLRVVEKYLVFRNQTSGSTWFQLQLAATYRQMNLEKHYNQTIEKLNTSQHKSSFQNADFYQNEYLLQAERYQWLSTQKRIGELNLQEVSNNIDLSYITQKLRQTCFTISHQTVYPKDYNLGLLSDMLKFLEKGTYLETPAVAVYYYYYLASAQANSDDAFKKFKTLLLEHSSLFPDREKRDLYLLATNYCIKKMNAGERQFAREGLDIYKEALSQDALFVDGRISRFTFFNILTKALVCEEFEWAELFISDYQLYLEEKHRDATASYSLARLEYQRGNHKSALRLLQKADYEDLLQNLQAKSIIAKIYFESEEHDVLASHLDAMQQFIRRRKVQIYHRDNFLNFISFLKKIVEIPSFEKEARSILKEAIQKEKAVLERRWLLEHL